MAGKPRRGSPGDFTVPRAGPRQCDQRDSRALSRRPDGPWQS